MPPGEYSRKAETQRNCRGPAQAVEHVVQFDATRRTLPGLERLLNAGRNTGTPQGGGAEGLHGCRPVMSCGGGLSPATSATPVLCCHHSVGNSQETASDKLEEGGDDVKSSWPLCPGLHTCYNGRYKAPQTREGEPIAKNRSQFGLQAATRTENGFLRLADRKRTRP